MSPPSRAVMLAEAFVEMADTLVDEFDVNEFLHTLTRHTAELAEVAAVGLLLADHHGQLQVMAASDERSKLLELFQVQHHEGPCLEAYRTQRPVTNADLSAASTRWPRFAMQATALGFRSVHAIPLRLRSTVIGALNLFGTDGQHLSAADLTMVQALADVATIGLLQERAITRATVLSEHLQHALESRIVIEQAKGAIAQALGIGVDEAFVRLRSYARSHNQNLSRVAALVLADPSLLTR